MVGLRDQVLAHCSGMHRQTHPQVLWGKGLEFNFLEIGKKLQAILQSLWLY